MGRVTAESTSESTLRDEGVEEFVLVPPQTGSALALATLKLGSAAATAVGPEHARVLGQSQPRQAMRRTQLAQGSSAGDGRGRRSEHVTPVKRRSHARGVEGDAVAGLGPARRQ